MLKLKLNKAEVDALPAHLKSEYKADGDNFILDTDVTFEDTLALKNATLHEKTARKAATDKIKVIEAELEELRTRAGSVTDLESSYKGRLTAAEKAAKDREAVLQKELHKLLVDNVAAKIAGDISTVPSLIIPHLKARLTVEEVDGAMITRVLDVNGKASAASVNDLQTEFLANKEFAPILTASKASGGGAHGSSRVPAGGKPFRQMNEQELTELYKADPVKFNQLAEAAKTAQ